MSLCAFCISPNDEDGDCTAECGHTAAEQVRVQRERDELEAVRAPHTYQGEAHKAEPCQYGGPAGCDSSALCGRQLSHTVHTQWAMEQSATTGLDDGLGEHCGCCAHRRGVGFNPCGGPNCPCSPHRQKELPPLTSAILARERDRRGTHPLDFVNEEWGDPSARWQR